MHGEELSFDPEVRAAYLAGEQVEWLEFPEELWEMLELVLKRIWRTRPGPGYFK